MSDQDLYDQFLRQYPAFDHIHRRNFLLVIVVFLVIVYFTPGTLPDEFRSLLTSPTAYFIKEKLNVPSEFPY